MLGWGRSLYHRSLWRTLKVQTTALPNCSSHHAGEFSSKRTSLGSLYIHSFSSQTHDISMPGELGPLLTFLRLTENLDVWKEREAEKLRLSLWWGGRWDGQTALKLM
jgi:hypothetical protein